MLFDLDHFKSINDMLGHAAGYAVLRVAARAIQCDLRPVDSFGRIGGEEFTVMLSGVETTTGRAIAERFRAAIAGMRVPGHPGLRVSASFGVAPVTEATRSAQALMEGTDRALYAAKVAGRNRVVAGEAVSARLD